MVLYHSLSAICAASSKKVRLAMHHTVRNVWGGRLPMEQETSRQVGLSCRRPSRRSRWCYRLHSWMAIQKHCSRIRQRLPRSCASSCLNGLAWRISLGFHSTLLCLIRSAQPSRILYCGVAWMSFSDSLKTSYRLRCFDATDSSSEKADVLKKCYWPQLCRK